MHALAAASDDTFSSIVGIVNGGGVSALAVVLVVAFIRGMIISSTTAQHLVARGDELVAALAAAQKANADLLEILKHQNGREE